MLYSMGHAKGKYQYLGWHRSMGLKENHYTLNPLICHCRKWVKRLYKHSLREVAHRFETPCQSLKYERPSSIIAVGPWHAGQPWLGQLYLWKINSCKKNGGGDHDNELTYITLWCGSSHGAKFCCPLCWYFHTKAGPSSEFQIFVYLSSDNWSIQDHKVDPYKTSGWWLHRTYEFKGQILC